MIKVRIRATGQVLEMIPSAALFRLKSGEAELFVEERREISARVSSAFERAAKFLRLA